MGEPERQDGGALTVAVTGPTGDIGRALMRALEAEPAVERVLGMARRPFRPDEAGWTKAEYRQGDILDRPAVDELTADADVVVHLAFIIFGGPDETRRVNLEGTRNVFESAAAAKAERLVYTSSVAAYGFHPDHPQPLTEDVEPRGSERLYYSAQKAELEGVLPSALAGTGTEGYVFRPCIVAGGDALALVDAILRQIEVGGRLGFARRALEELPFLAPVLPDPGIPIQLVHQDDVASALVAAALGQGPPGAYNLGADDTIRMRDIAAAMGWHSVSVPRAAVEALAEALARVPMAPAELSWINAGRVPVVMDAGKAKRELGWEPRHTSRATLRETVAGARREGLLG